MSRKERQYYSNCIPGDGKILGDTKYLVSPKGNWLRQSLKISKKAFHLIEVKQLREKKEASLKLRKLEKSNEGKNRIQDGGKFCRERNLSEEIQEGFEALTKLREDFDSLT